MRPDRLTFAAARGLSNCVGTTLLHFRDSDAFDADEKLVLELAEAITATPALVSDDSRSGWWIGSSLRP